jgi:hypothetical protein
MERKKEKKMKRDETKRADCAEIKVMSMDELKTNEQAR